MDGFRIRLLVFLLLTLYFTSQKTAAYPPCNVQDFYPGCKINQSYVPSPLCSRSHGPRENNASLSNFTDFIINTTQLTDCFFNSSNKIFHLSAYYRGYIKIDGNISTDACVADCVCEVVLCGPPQTRFLLNKHVVNGEGLTVSIREFSSESEFTIPFEDVVWSRVESIHIVLSVQSSGTVYFLFYVDIFDIRLLIMCHNQLEVNCLSETSGTIDTPGWRNGSRYPDNMDSCVALHVPPEHVIMISLVSIDVEGGWKNTYCVDYLQLHTNGDCSNLHNHICGTEDLPPTLLTGRSVVSFRFYSDFSIVNTGFRLLWSFHNSSEVPPQLPGGKWNCNVPYYSSFQQHFTCHAETFCSDRRDKAECPTDNVCGSNLVMFGGSCYRIFRPNFLTTWDAASDTCSKFGGSLAVLHGVSELLKSIQFLEENEEYGYVFIGLRRASTVTLLEMYQNTWLWSDNTLAVYLPIRFREVSPPHCAVFHGNILTVVSCKDRIQASYLCETDFTSDQNENATQISMPVHSNWTTDGLTKCRHNHFTHTFLACDVSANCSAVNLKQSLVCSNNLSPPVPLFTCRNQVEHVPYTLVCDFRSDCCDRSDEDFCVFPVPESRKDFECADSKQSIPRERMCDKRRDCVDGSDETTCWEGLSLSEQRPNHLIPPARVDFTAFGNFTVTPLPSFLCPETHFLCPGEDYCLPVYVRCNNIYDCPGYEDEIDCDHYTCPGYFRCRESKICLHRQHLCDDMPQCPQHDDELMCNFTCPEKCLCSGHAFICSHFFTPGNDSELRYLDASNSGISPEVLSNNTKLIHLSLRFCQIRVVGQLDFPNLQSLDLSNNLIYELSRDRFNKLGNLVSLSLAHNPIKSLAAIVDSDLKFSKITSLNLSGIEIPELNEAFLEMFPNVRHLNISGSGLMKTTQIGFQPLNSLHMLDLRGCPIETFFQGVFKGLDRLETIYTDNYKLCCSSVLPEGMDSENCRAPSDEISSCDALLRADVYRVFLGFYAILALTGNLGSFVYRVFFQKSSVNMGYEIFVTHLCVADFLMGMYLAIIGIADRLYYGNYRWNDVAWKHSVACKVAGFLSLLSSEVSAYLICLITLERFLVVRFPHKALRFSQRSAHAASMTVWLIGLTLAVIPLLPMTSHWDFYSQSGICVPLPVTRNQFDGKDYAFAIMILINFVLFLFIAIGQLLIYRSIQVNSIRSNDHRNKSKDMAIARRLLAVVMTDFMCWFPIGLLGVLARIDIPISSEINVAMAIFVLPFNSALNPFLYTFNVMRERRRKVNQLQKSSNEGEPRSSHNMATVNDIETENRTEETYSHAEAFQLFKCFLEDGLLTPEQVRHRVWEIYEG